MDIFWDFRSRFRAGAKGRWLATGLAAALWLSGAANAAAHERELRGKIEDDSGAPLHQAEVLLYREGRTEPLGRVFSDHEGRFRFQVEHSWELSIAALKDGFEPATLSIPDDFDYDREVILMMTMALPVVATELSVFGAIPRSAASSSSFRQDLFNSRPRDDIGDILRIVPGLTVVQHAGAGKANQYLIRGFDADHGTDFLLTFAGIPVNVVSHAHGQGYSDLNFLIPETLESIDVYKGPYFAELGNLATAGAAVMQLRESFPEEAFLSLEGGSFDTARILAGYSPKGDDWRGFAVVESRYSNGPFESPQDYERLNLATRWTFDLNPTQRLSLMGTGYLGNWNQSGQIPLREVEAGRLDRFGSIDSSEGGDSSRINFSLSHQKLWSKQALNSQFFYVRYGLDLFSNFTFFANDPVRGDGILQSDRRDILGGRLQYHAHFNSGGVPGIFTAGLDVRQDFADVALSRQQERNVFDQVVDSRIDERNLGFYLQQEFQLHSALKAIVGLRHDRFRFDVDDRLGEGPEGVRETSQTGPKLSLVFSPKGDDGPEFYANYGRGFHSNDARSAVADPSGVALAAADGYEAGYRQVLFDRLELSLAYWLLDLEGELVFVGDEGTTELSGPTRRHGPEAEAKFRINDFLWADAEMSYTFSGFRGSEDVIARAPRFVASGGLAFETPYRLSGNLRLRHVGSHPIVEDDSAQAEGYTVADLFLKYPLRDRLQLSLSVENLFDAEVKEAQTYFESQLPGEPNPVSDNHFTAGNPFTLRAGIRFSF